VKLEPDPKGGRGRVGLSLRALAPDPWATAEERFPVGASVCGRVRRLEQFGAFVELAPGIDGLVHVSRLALDRRLSHARQIGPGAHVDGSRRPCCLTPPPELRILAPPFIPQPNEEEPMIKLYGVPRSRTARAIWMLEELQIPYENVPVSFIEESRKPAYMKINPNGHIPALQDGDLTLFESLAINLYLARKYDKGLWPKTIE